MKARLTSCPNCGKDWTQFLFLKAGGRIVRCRGCGLIYVNPRLTAEASQLEYASDDYYQQREIAHESPFRQWLAQTDLRHIQQYHQDAPGRLLDTGCGTGFFLSLARRAGWTVSGVEISQIAVRLARERYGLSVRWGSLIQLNLSDWEGAYDVVTLWDVLEHLPEPRPHLEVIRRLLRSKGIVALSTPNVEGLTLRLLGKRSRVFSPHEHLAYYSRRTLADLLLSCGFRILRMQTQSLYLHNLIALLTRQSEKQSCLVQSRYHRAYQRFQGQIALHLIRTINLGLRLIGVGDSLIAFARKP